MKELFKCTSQNGRWGIAIAGEEGEIHEGVPFFGKMTSLGRVSGIETYRLDKGTDCFCIFGNDIKAVTNAQEIQKMDLQGNGFVSLIAINPKGYSLIKVFGYKYRSSWYSCYKNGEEVNISESVLVAMRLIEPEKEEELSFAFDEMEPKNFDDKLDTFSNSVVDTIIEELSEKGINIKEHREILFKPIKTSNMMMTLLPLFL